MKMTFYHLTGSARGRTQFIDADSVSFGTGDQCGITFDRAVDAAVYPLQAELTVENGYPIIRDRSGKRALLVNGLRQTEALLRDGDLLQFGEQGPQMRFRLSPNQASDTKSWRTIVEDSQDIVVRTPHTRYLSPLYLARHIFRDIVLHASPVVKTAAAIVLIAPLLLISWLGVVVHREHQAATVSERRMAELSSQLQTGRLTQAELEQRIERERQGAEALRRQQEGEIVTLMARLKVMEAARESTQDVRAIQQQLSAIRQSQSFAEDIVRRFGGSVGLLQGGYGFKERTTGRPLRYQGLDQLGNPYVDKDGNALVTLEGIAPRVLIYFAGTAFLVDRAGTVVTNRHMVHMWESFEPAKQAIAAGFEPDMVLLRLFFPGEEAPYLLTEVRVSDRVDIAVLRTDRVPAAGTPLVLATGMPIHVGEPVVMVSYPGTVDTLLARTSQSTSQAILAKAGGDPVRLVNEVAQKKLIRPLATQGHLSDVSPDLITYEAASASGSSGAPIFNRAGAVIGINHATLQRVEGVHMALPIRFVADLLNQPQQHNP
ncbi:MAG: trypsin-like peptidase domain-containing protein [Nitrospirota bacterium]